MATKTADKKKKATPAKAVKAPVDQSALLAEEFLVQRLQNAIVSNGEPMKVADLVAALDDDAITLGLARQALAQHPQRFVAIDRRWDVATRYIDRARPMEKILEEIVSVYGSPIAAWEAAHELGLVLERSTEGTQVVVDKLLNGSGRFFAVGEEGRRLHGLSSWLLETSDSYHTEQDYLFYNYLPVNALEPYRTLSLDWMNDPVGSAVKVVEAAPGKALKVVDIRLMGLIAYQALGADFDGTSLFGKIAASGELFILTGHRWTNAAGIEALRSILRAQAQQVAEQPEEEEPELEETPPLSVTVDDLLEMARFVADADPMAVRAGALLQEVYDTAPGDRGYIADSEALLAALLARPDQFLWVGYDRFRKPASLPPYIGQVPESLNFPQIAQIESPEGDLLDQILDDEGFERGLERELLSPVAQDNNDQELPQVTVWPEGASAESEAIRLVLKAHHKEIGTFPLAQVPLGFFDVDSTIVELVLREQNGTAHQVFVDYDTQLIYGLGLFDLYSNIAADSGAVFHLKKTSVPGEFAFVNDNETDAEVYVSGERLEQLQGYRSEIENGPTVSTHDVVRYVLEHSNQAISYISLLTEVNVVRRVTRRQLASILSAWTGFTHRAGLWTYDAKKGIQGFNKAKRKYVR